MGILNLQLTNKNQHHIPSQTKTIKTEIKRK